MNSVFWFLVILGAILLWLLLSVVFYPLGCYIKHIVTVTVNRLMKDDEDGK